MRAKVAADPKQDRYIMSQTACERHHVLAPMNQPHAVGELSRHNHTNQRADRPVDTVHATTVMPIARFQAPLHIPSRSPGASVAPTIMVGGKINPP